jgi:hypothetical protein
MISPGTGHVYEEPRKYRLGPRPLPRNEIGDRLREILRQSASALPPRLNDLMARLAEADRETSPSLIPSIRDMTAGRETLTPHRDDTSAYADLAV